MPLRHPILRGGATAAEIVETISAEYERLNCDGLFLPAVSHDGIRLPVDAICERVSQIRKPKFVVVDGAQAFFHVPSELGIPYCDFFLTGCHKWLRAHAPMGVAFCPQPETSDRVRSTCDRMLLAAELDDPLLRFTREIEDDTVRPFSETVTLASLFTCQAAVSQRRRRQEDLTDSLSMRLANAEALVDATRETGWQLVRPTDRFRSGIVLLEVQDGDLRKIEPEKMRDYFLTFSIGLTCYDGGLVRLSMPDRPWRGGELDLMRWALAWFAGRESIFVKHRSQMPVAI